MSQLLVRNLEPAVIRSLKARAKDRGVALEEEHRRILREACLSSTRKPGLIDFLRDAGNAAAPAVELDLTRSRRSESRDAGF